MEIISGSASRLTRNIVDHVARYRHRVFVDMLGWTLDAHDGLELDQFDHKDTVHFAAFKDDGQVVGVARLLPTTGPYLLGDVFPQLMGDLPAPKRPDVWELSRFAAVDLDEPSASPMLQFSSPVAIDLLSEVLAYAAKHGASRLITVSPLGIERLLRRAGFAAHRAAPPVMVDGQPLFACWIEVQGPASA